MTQEMVDSIVSGGCYYGNHGYFLFHHVVVS
jgi:hypothetical protein